MKFINILVFILFLGISTSCQSFTRKKVAVVEEGNKATYKQLDKQNLSKYETAYFASGCFWCVEAIFESVKGVKEVISGYSGGKEKNPTYEQVGGGMTSHAEAVKIYYDPKVISFTALVQVFFGSHDPTSLNRQGPDRGRQYRSVAFYKNETEKKIISDYISLLKSENIYDGAPITTEVTAFEKFYIAEDYHQDYERNNPNNSYIRNVSVPRLNRFKENFGDYLKDNAH
ncbi:peptide-methionine (S)-S-oxide reductase MsrA [Aurantibacter sp.]|uniref:peptide-methionine (S)-S-oxide reductase MsrA n=1 Tax=Aurantibacter sp. TaxID=2807103 RepID=UPI0032638589